VSSSDLRGTRKAGHGGMSPAEGHNNDWRTGASVVQGKAKRAGASWGEKALGKSYQCL